MGRRGRRQSGLTAWLDAVHVIWVDEQRTHLAMRLQAAQLDMLHRLATGGKNGWAGYDDFTDPADLLEDLAQAGDPAGQVRDPALRAAQIAAFVAATGGEEG